MRNKTYIKMVVIAILWLSVVSCETNIEKRTIKDKYIGQEVEVLTIDSCEYIKIKGTENFSHKGNCKFCKERLNK